MKWNLWSRQIDAIVRLELKRYVLGRRWIGVYLLCLAPVFLLLVRALTISARASLRAGSSAALLSTGYAVFFQVFLLRFALFFSCAVVFSQMFRGEILEKTLHYYLLAPVRREVLAVGKYVAGLVATILLFGASTIVTYLLMFLPSTAGSAFLASGGGIGEMAKYVAIAMLACLGYGAVFLFVGIFVRNPATPTAILLLTESSSSLLPSALQKLTVIHYLQALFPVPINRGPFAVVTESPQPLVAVPGLILFTVAVLALAAWKIRRMEVTYSTD